MRLGGRFLEKNKKDKSLDKFFEDNCILCSSLVCDGTEETMEGCKLYQEYKAKERLKVLILKMFK